LMKLKNQWGWGGFTTQDLKRCRLLARSVGLIYNWWSLFVRLADPEHYREAITSRPLLLQAIARQTRHAGQTKLTVSSTHGERIRRGVPIWALPASLLRYEKKRSSWNRCSAGITFSARRSAGS
ncbi:MAG: hypothetical protein JO212_15920, partial [Acetobacteraceae bacterium]|nr:hypothetical protein [Acetobacteraceae bacterium]